MMSEVSRKRPWRAVPPSVKRRRTERALSVGMQGVLITCNMNAQKCTADAYSLLGEYGDKLYGPEEACVLEGSDSEDQDDVEAALRKEVTQIQASFAKRQRRFQAMSSGANNVVFIRTHNIDPEKLVHYIMHDLQQTKKKKSRVILRMLPVGGTCRAFYEDMEKYLSSYLEPWFRAPNRASYQINFKARNSSHKRDDVIRLLAGVVARLNPKNRVNLTNPELTIMVEIIKSVCCISVIRDYRLFKKYNLQEITRGADSPGQGEQQKETGLEEVEQQKETGLEEVEQQKETGLEEAEQQKETGLEEAEQQKETGKETGLEEAEQRKETGLEEAEQQKETGLEEAEQQKETGLEEAEQQKDTLFEAVGQQKEAGPEEAGQQKEADLMREKRGNESGQQQDGESEGTAVVQGDGNEGTEQQ